MQSPEVLTLGYKQTILRPYDLYITDAQLPSTL